MKRHKETVHLLLEPVWYHWVSSEPTVKGFRVVKTTKRMPKNATGVVVQLELDVPDAAFLPLRPVAAIVIETGDVDVQVAVEPPE